MSKNEELAKTIEITYMQGKEGLVSYNYIDANRVYELLIGYK